VVEETGLAYASKVKVTRPDGHEVGVMHACGHDVHQTCLVGTAAVLASLKDRWSGKVMLVAQPAEEIVAGARAMIADGLFETHGKADACIALHVSADKPAGTVACTPGWALANSDTVDITIFGRGGHGSRPHDSVDPIVIAAHVVTSLQTIVSRRVDPIDSAVITVGSIHAGSKANIIPDEAKLQLTVRSYTAETRELLLDGIREVTTNTCRALGSPKDPQIVHHEEEHAPATWNDPGLTESAAEVFRQVLGSDRVLEQKPVMGAEDFGRYGTHLKVPSLMFWLGSVPRTRYEASLTPGGEPLPSAHSSKYYPDPEPTIATGVKCMTHLALALLNER
jgi:hippurate hydrolase